MKFRFDSRYIITAEALAVRCRRFFIRGSPLTSPSGRSRLRSSPRQIWSVKPLRAPRSEVGMGDPPDRLAAGPLHHPVNKREVRHSRALREVDSLGRVIFFERVLDKATKLCYTVSEVI